MLLMVVAGVLRRRRSSPLCSACCWRKYRDIFFAMLSLAFSMILYGLLVKTSALGSTDGFGLQRQDACRDRRWATHWVRYVSLCVHRGARGRRCALGMHRYLNSHLGRLAGAIRDNELRVEYMGASVRRVIHLNYVIAAALAGIGGALMAIAIGHVDPEMANWTTSGEFVFIAILSRHRQRARPFPRRRHLRDGAQLRATSTFPTPGRWRSASPCCW